MALTPEQIRAMAGAITPPTGAFTPPAQDTETPDLSRWFGGNAGAAEQATPQILVPSSRADGMDPDYVRQMNIPTEVIAQNPTNLAAVQNRALAPTTPTDITAAPPIPLSRPGITTNGTQVTPTPTQDMLSIQGGQEATESTGSIVPPPSSDGAIISGTPAEGLVPFIDPSGRLAYAAPDIAQGFNTAAGAEQSEANAAQKRFLQSPAADAMSNRMIQSVRNSPFEQASAARQARIGGTGSFAGDSAAREARLAERSDFGTAISDRERRGTGEMSMAEATRMAGGNRKAARAMIERQRQGIGEFAEPTDDRTPEEIEADRLDVERKRQIVEQGKQPHATPEQKKASARQQAVEAGTITQAQADEANKRDLIGNPPAGYDTWAQYESETGTDADGDGKVATQQEAAQASASPEINAAELSGQDRAAYEWAQANPGDPRSVKILERLSK